MLHSTLRTCSPTLPPRGIVQHSRVFNMEHFDESMQAMYKTQTKIWTPSEISHCMDHDHHLYSIYLQLRSLEPMLISLDSRATLEGEMRLKTRRQMKIRDDFSFFSFPLFLFFVLCYCLFSLFCK